MPSLSFWGGAGMVTGSKYLVRHGRTMLLLEAGMFQGLKEWRVRNWADPPVDVSRIHAVVLSHAHIDHSGYLPRMVKLGFRGKVFCTPGTADLLRVMLTDAAALQEEEAERANRHGYTKHRPALPLYTLQDVHHTLKQVRTCRFNEPARVGDGITLIFRRVGHILGAASIDLEFLDRRGGRPGVFRNESTHRLVFSGDLGRWNQPIIRDPQFVRQADTLLLEGTYGDRVHAEDPNGELAAAIQEAIARGGAILIPSFAVGRTQEMIWRLRELEEAGRIPALPVYLDSPMASDVTSLYQSHTEEHDREMAALMRQDHSPLSSRRFHAVKSIDESKALNRQDRPMIIIASSGMATAGRILHHLRLRLADPKTTVLLVGFQAAGTRGRAMQQGAHQIKIHGQEVPVRAHVQMLHGLSAHADRDDLLRWLSGFERPPRQTYIVHAEPEQASSLAQAIQTRYGWNVRPAVDGETVSLNGEAV